MPAFQLWDQSPERLRHWPKTTQLGDDGAGPESGLLPLGHLFVSFGGSIPGVYTCLPHSPVGLLQAEITSDLSLQPPALSAGMDT